MQLPLIYEKQFCSVSTTLYIKVLRVLRQLLSNDKDVIPVSAIYHDSLFAKNLNLDYMKIQGSNALAFVVLCNESIWFG